MVKVLALTKYGSLGASSRLRLLQYLPWLDQAGVQVVVRPLLSNEILSSRYQQGRYGLSQLVASYARRVRELVQRQKFVLIWIEAEALPWWPIQIELSLLDGVPFVLDFDDAVFHHYDKHANYCVRRWLGRRIDGLMAHAKLVIGGNQYLADRALDAGAPWVEVVPTVVDMRRYGAVRQKKLATNVDIDLPRVVWIGSPTTVQYLQLIREPLQELASRRPFILRVIGGGTVDIPGVQLEILPWSEFTEVENISDCQVGVMPLLDSIWEKGKCGYKLIQYMACGLPVVASDVGVNAEIVRDGEAGYLVSNSHEWVDTLDKLLRAPLLRAKLGAAGRKRVEESYCIQKTGPVVAQLLRTAAGKA